MWKPWIGVPCLAGIVGIALLMQRAPGQHSPEALARLGLEALRSGELGAFHRAVPQPYDLVRLVEHVRRVAGDEAYHEQVQRIQFDGGFKHAGWLHLDTNQRSLADAREAAGGRVDWASAQFDGLDRNRTRLKMRYGLIGGQIAFRVRDKNGVSIFRLANCMRSYRGWLCGSGFRFERGPR